MGADHNRDAYVHHNQDFHLWIARGARNAPLQEMVALTCPRPRYHAIV